MNASNVDGLLSDRAILSLGGTTQMSHFDFPRPIELWKIIEDTYMNIFLIFLKYIY
jgi:hypothetical protein